MEITLEIEVYNPCKPLIYLALKGGRIIPVAEYTKSIFKKSIGLNSKIGTLRRTRWRRK